MSESWLTARPGDEPGRITVAPEAVAYADPEVLLAAIERALSYAVLPARFFAMTGLTAPMSPADRDALLLRFAVTWLVSNGLVAVGPPEVFKRWLSNELAEPFARDVMPRVRDAVEHLAGVTAALEWGPTTC